MNWALSYFDTLYSYLNFAHLPFWITCWCVAVLILIFKLSGGNVLPRYLILLDSLANWVSLSDSVIKWSFEFNIFCNWLSNFILLSLSFKNYSFSLLNSSVNSSYLTNGSYFLIPFLSMFGITILFWNLTLWISKNGWSSHVHLYYPLVVGKLKTWVVSFSIIAKHFCLTIFKRIFYIFISSVYLSVHSRSSK